MVPSDMTGVIVGRRLWFLSVTVALTGALTPVSGAHAAPPTCDGKRATIVGTEGRDTIRGSRRDDVIVALAGRDVIDGRGGDDVVCGGAGYDRIHGGGGDDRILGQGDGCYWDEGCFYFGDDLSGGAGNDTIIGGDPRAPDVVRFQNATRGVVVDLAAGTTTGQGTDTLVGIGEAVTTPYDDVVSGQRGFSAVSTGAGDDLVTSAAPGWYGYLTTGDGADRVTTAGRGDVSTGGGDDVVEAAGAVTATTGDGDDTITLGGGGYVETGPGDDVVQGSSKADDIHVNGGNDVVLAAGGSDYVRDGAGASEISGGAGDDWIQGFRGADSYDGGEGVDEIDYLQLYGDSGIVLDLAAGTVTGESGDDAITGFEKANGSPQDDTILGDEGGNWLSGDEGVDVVRGRGGDDNLVARWGAPSLFGDAGDDRVVVELDYGNLNGLSFDGGEGRDLFFLSGFVGANRPMVIDLLTGVVTGAGSAPLVGFEDVNDNLGDHTIIGTDETNVLFGRGGDDDIRGLGGDDVISGDAGDDRADGGDGTDQCEAETEVACEIDP